MKQTRSADRRLTEVELEMMNVIWRLGPCTVSQVLAALNPERALAYTSVSTMIRILEQKRFVTSRKDGRRHLYEAIVAKDDYQADSIDYMVRKVFDNTPATLVRQLLASQSLSAEEVQEIQSLLATHRSPSKMRPRIRSYVGGLKS